MNVNWNVKKIHQTKFLSNHIPQCLTNFNVQSERDSRHQWRRELGIKTQEEAHLFKQSARSQMSRRWWRRGEMWGEAWVPGAWEVNCTVCPPSGDNQQSVCYNQPQEESRGGGRASSSRNNLKCWSDRKRQRMGEHQDLSAATICMYLFTSCNKRLYVSAVLSCAENKTPFNPGIMPNPCLYQQNIRHYEFWILKLISTSLSVR